MSYKIGHGIDVHQLVEGESLILGGIKIKSDKGTLGHSDGDALLHALTDAILGALALGDIGTFFPSTEDKWKNANSQIFLNYALKQLKDNNYIINNIDINIILQKPAINKYVKTIKEKLSKIININSSLISIKATTTDFLGYIGENKGIAIHAMILINHHES